MSFAFDFSNEAHDSAPLISTLKFSDCIAIGQLRDFRIQLLC